MWRERGGESADCSRAEAVAFQRLSSKKKKERFFDCGESSVFECFFDAQTRLFYRKGSSLVRLHFSPHGKVRQ